MFAFAVGDIVFAAILTGVFLCWETTARCKYEISLVCERYWNLLLL